MPCRSRRIPRSPPVRRISIVSPDAGRRRPLWRSSVGSVTQQSPGDQSTPAASDPKVWSCQPPTSLGQVECGSPAEGSSPSVPPGPVPVRAGRARGLMARVVEARNLSRVRLEKKLTQINYRGQIFRKPLIRKMAIGQGRDTRSSVEPLDSMSLITKRLWPKPRVFPHATRATALWFRADRF
jgi:hypothetical protein